MDSAVEFWKMFYGRSKAQGGLNWNSTTTPWLDWWIEFYESKCKRPVNKDLWTQVHSLVEKTREPNGEDMSWWSEDGAWPGAVDEFVEFVKKKRTACCAMDIS